MANYDGLTRNAWPGTWSPSANHPIVLDTEIRGGLRYISGNSGDQLADIKGQRLQEGMLVYIDNSYTSGSVQYNGGRYYQYQLQLGESRNIATGELPNSNNNWSEFTTSTLDLQSVIDVVDSAYVLYRSTNYIQQEINKIIDAAPEALDTLNELAAAINDDSNFAGTITNSIATKLASADFETYFDSNLGRETSISTIRSYFSAAGDLTYDSNTGVFEFDVESIYTKTNFDSDLNLALSTDAITTTELTEGENLYYTNTRWDSAFYQRIQSIDGALVPSIDSAYDLGSINKKWKSLWVAGDTIYLGDISISASEDGSLAIARIDSVGDTVEDIGSISTKNLDNAINLDLDSIGQQEIDIFDGSQYRTARYVIQMSSDSNSKYHSTEVLLMHNGNDVFMTEYAILKTQDSDVGSLTASISNTGNVKLLITPNFTNVSIKAKRLIIDV